jgi:two-component sensor histidine kinase
LKVETPLLVPVLAALVPCACMAILGLPSFGHSHAAAFRTLYFVACLAWLVPLALLQRAGWRREWHWLPTVLLLLAATYAMSVLNALLGQRLAIELGMETGYQWGQLFYGLDSCWLALTSFCAMHAVAVYYLSLQQAGLRLAQAQTNPHFLFNSLNAISALVASQANREANHMLGCVSDFLRATLAHDGRHEHTLAEELALLDAYLEIEKARLGERLRLTMKAGPDLLDSAVPYLMLQPLVENAIRHGIAPLAAPGRLDIRVERAGQRLLLDVRNDGRRPVQAGASGIGLSNVAQRLRHLYGDAQQVDAGWGEDGRFGVRIALPLRLVDAAA